MQQHSTAHHVTQQRQRYACVTEAQRSVLTTYATLCMFITISMYADDQGECWPSMKRLIEESQLPQSTAYRAFRTLLRIGLISRDDARKVITIHATPKVVRLVPAHEKILTDEKKILTGENRIHYITTQLTPHIERPGPNEDQTENDTMPVRLSNVYASGGDEDKPRKKASPNNKLSARRKCADRIAQHTMRSCHDAVKLDSLIAEYGVDTVLSMIDEAWRNRDKLLNDKYPSFTAGTVWVYAVYHRRSDKKTSEPQAPTLNIDREIAHATRNGKLDLDTMHNIIDMFSLRRDDLRGKVGESELDVLFPARLD